MASGAAGVVDRLLAEPPDVHDMTTQPGAELGLWSTERDCYLLMEEHATPGTRSLETGSGLSTILLTALGATHTCVTPSQGEADRIVDYCKAHDISTTSLTFEIGCSDEVLPRLEPKADYDLLLIDGNHGFPVPMIDWYYGASVLKRGGLLIIDDIALPAVAHLVAFLDRDPRFEAHRRTDKWAAFWKVEGGDLRQDWFDQPSFPAPLPTTVRGLAERAVGKLRRSAAARRRPASLWHLLRSGS